MLSNKSLYKLSNKIYPFNKIPRMVTIENYNNIICNASHDFTILKILSPIHFRNDLKHNETLLLDIYELMIGRSLINNKWIPSIFIEIKNESLPIRIFYDDDIEIVKNEFLIWKNFLELCNVTNCSYSY
jgi:hypothetical protein